MTRTRKPVRIGLYQSLFSPSQSVFVPEASQRTKKRAYLDEMWCHSTHLLYLKEINQVGMSQKERNETKRKEIGRYLRFVRKAKGFTQAELAKLMNTDRWHLQELEKGRTAYQIDTFFNWMEALRLGLNILPVRDKDEIHSYLISIEK